MKIYKVHLYYGGEIMDRTVIAKTLESAQNYVDSAEHGEIEPIDLTDLI